jgi:anti-sigma factor RsiW
MSRCKETQAFLHQAELDQALPEEVQAHLASCPACAACREDLRLMATQMRGLEPPQLPDGFELSLRRQLMGAAGEKQQSQRPSRHTARRKVMPLVFAAAATVLIAFGGLAIWKRYSAPASVTPTYHKLHLSVHATERHDDVVFAVRLPADVALSAGLDGLAAADGTIRWRSVLQPGVNAIDLPLVATLSADGAKQIQAQVTVKGRTTTRTVAIPTTAASASAREAKGIQLAFVLPRGEGRVVQ